VEIVFLRSHPWPPWRLFFRNPQLAVGCGTSYVTSKLIRSDVAHVAVVCGELVIEKTNGGCFYYDAVAWRIAQHKHISESFDIGDTDEAHADEILRMSPYAKTWKSIHILGTLANWLSGGMIPWRTCLGPAVSALTATGHRVPRRVTTPMRLRVWLHAHGFGHIAAPPRHPPPA
jgi:hypothetical protein